MESGIRHGVARSSLAFIRRVATMLWFRSIPSRNHVRFFGRGKVFFNVTDNRARWLRASAGVTQPLVTWMWGTLVRRWHPDIVVDVGANYGEIALSTAYESHVRIVLVEANPLLLPYLRKSCTSHRSAQQITLFDFFASASHGTVGFVLDEKWSGTSSAVMPIQDAEFKGGGAPRNRRIEVGSSPLGPHLAKFIRPSDERLLIKIDVEGGELDVLEGLRGILASVPHWILIVEHNPAILNASRRTTEAFALYQSLGAVFAWDTEGNLRRVATADEIDESPTDIVICDDGPVSTRFVIRLHAPSVLRHPFRHLPHT